MFKTINKDTRNISTPIWSFSVKGLPPHFASNIEQI